MHQCGAGGSELGDTGTASTIRLRPWTYRPVLGSEKRPNDPKCEALFTLRHNFDGGDESCRLYTVHRICSKQSACHGEVIGLSCFQHGASDGSRGLNFSDDAPCRRGSQTLICTGKTCATGPRGRGCQPVPAMRAPSLGGVAPMWGRRPDCRGAASAHQSRNVGRRRPAPRAIVAPLPRSRRERLPSDRPRLHRGDAADQPGRLDTGGEALVDALRREIDARGHGPATRRYRPTSP